jgi:hypothetical protein
MCRLIQLQLRSDTDRLAGDFQHVIRQRQSPQCSLPTSSMEYLSEVLNTTTPRRFR